MTLDRRDFLAACSRAGITSALLPGILYTLASQGAEAQQLVKGPSGHAPSWDKITPEMLDQAAELAGVGPFTDAQKKMMLDSLTHLRDGYAQIRALKLPNSVAPAFVFHPQPAAQDPLSRMREKAGMALGHHAYRTPNSLKGWTPDPAAAAPARIEDLAFATVSELASLLRARNITSVALTKMYLARLKRYDPTLHFTITLTEDRALAQAKKADEEIAAGKYRGPLHGIPWGAKDLLAVKG
ncbi:MAG: amidase family protein, partial [Terracidiphilus sp.]